MARDSWTSRRKLSNQTNNSNNSNRNNMGGPSTPDHPAGREQAIETLIDMDPRGAFFRASRIMEEAAPNALLARPNRVTLAALVDSAHSLSRFETSRYDANYLRLTEAAPAASPITVSNETQIKEDDQPYIFRHVRKIIMAKNKKSSLAARQWTTPNDADADATQDENDGRSSVQPTLAGSAPPSQLVSGLRRLYTSSSSLDSLSSRGSSNSNALLPMLLKAIMDHEAFSGVDASPVSQNKMAGLFAGLQKEFDSAAKATETTLETGGMVEPAEACAANLETIISNVCQMAMTTGSKTTTRNDEKDVVQGLLIASLSVLTGSILGTEDNQDDVMEEDIEEASGGFAEQKRNDSMRSTPIDYAAPNSASIQVGSLLALLEDKGGELMSKDDFGIDANLLEYFAKAAAVYEERIELQKERLLSKMQAEFEAVAEQQKSSKAESSKDDVTKDKDEVSPYPFPVVPTTPPASSSNIHHHGTVTEDEGSEAEGSGVNLSAERQNAEAAAQEESDAEFSGGIDLGENSSEDDDDSSRSMGDEYLPVASPLLGVGSELEGDSNHLVLSSSARSQFTTEGNDAHEQEELDEDSSSSSSDSSEDDRQLEALLNGVRDDDEDDEAEGEDILLRRALAMSLTDSQMNLDAEDSDDNETSLADNDVDTNINANATGSFQTPLLSQSIANENDEEEDDLNLPPMPTAPTHFPFLPVRMTPKVELGEEEELGQLDEAAYFNPGSLSAFGAIPSPNVLVRFLSHLKGILEGNVLVNDSAKGSESAPSSNFSGGSPFATPTNSAGFRSPVLDAKAPKELGDDTVTFHLLIAGFVFLADARTDAISKLRQALLSAVEHLPEQEDGTVGHQEEPYEEDDPALTAALQYLGSQAPATSSSTSPSGSASTTSQSLETKGLRRKAAAAAHIAALRSRSIRNNILAWKDRLRLYSMCTGLMLQCLHLFLLRLSQDKLQNDNVEMDSESSSLKTSVLISTKTSSKLNAALSALTSSNVSLSYRDLFEILNKNTATSQTLSRKDLHHALMPFELYHAALTAWGEAIPFLLVTHGEREELLLSLIDECALTDNKNNASSISINVDSVPWSDSQVKLGYLRVLCRRLRASDMLEAFITSPARFNNLIESDGGSSLSQVGRPTTDVDAAHESGGSPSVIAALLGSIASYQTAHQDEGCSDFVLLYLALCHRFNARLLIWDDFHGLSASDDPVYDELASTSSVVSGASGISVSSTPSNRLEFDSTKSSGSIAILSEENTETASSPNGPSAHQRASKVWGTILSSKFYSPKTGVHRWAIRLDKCERGHVFVGVATAQANMRTYVGGDKNGWGVIGTQALWHDRSKIRGDYGATFRTGSTIVVTLDTDAGTLSFGVWNDPSSGHQGPDSPASTQNVNLLSPMHRGGSAASGCLEDWGIAFEGLPLDAKLFPAVGLYQRDDRVTLLSVSSSGRGTTRRGAANGTPGSEGECYYPPIKANLKEDELSKSILAVRKCNDSLSREGIQYVSDVLTRVTESIDSTDALDDLLLFDVLPSLACSLCLMPSSIPEISGRQAMLILPQLTRCVRALNSLLSPTRRVSHSIFDTFKAGKWTIRATGPSQSNQGNSNDYEEYIVNFSNGSSDGESSGFYGTGIGTTDKSKDGHVSIAGTSDGSALHFVEEWSDSSDDRRSSKGSTAMSSCIVEARLGLDGSKFEGVYHNVQYGTTGYISGVLCSEEATLDEPRSWSNLTNGPANSVEDERQNAIVRCEALLCLAVGHLACILVSNVTTRDIECQSSVTSASNKSLSSWVTSPLFSCGFFDGDRSKTKQSIECLSELYLPSSIPWGNESTKEATQRASSVWDQMIQPLLQENGSDEEYNIQLSDLSISDAIDSFMSQKSGGKGTLSMLFPEGYAKTRILIVGVLLKHTNLYSLIRGRVEIDLAESSYLDNLVYIWNAALRIMEDGLRSALAASVGIPRKEACQVFCSLMSSISEFLSCTSTQDQYPRPIADVVTEVQSFYRAVTSDADLLYLDMEMRNATSRSILRYLALYSVRSLLSDITSSNEDSLATTTLAEYCILSLPRLLGCGMDASQRNKGKEGSILSTYNTNDLGGHYLTNLSGAALNVQHSIRNCVHELFSNLGSDLTETIVGDHQSGTPTFLSNHSLTLSILAIFAMTMRSSDVEKVLGHSHMLQCLQLILSRHRNALSHDPAIPDFSEGVETIAVMEQLKRGRARNISCITLRAAVSVTHVVLFQLTSHLSLYTNVSYGSDQDDLLTPSVVLLLGELSAAISLLESLSRREGDRSNGIVAETEWARWCEQCSADHNFTRRLRQTPSYDNSEFVSEVAVFMQDGSTVGASAYTRSPVVASGGIEYVPSHLTIATHYFSYLLNVLGAVTHSTPFISILLRDSSWIEVLFGAVGLTFSQGNEGEFSISLSDECLMPARYRVRLLRFLRQMLLSMEPNEEIVCGLLLLAGRGKNFSDEHDVFFCSVVGSEAVSVLRHLYLPMHISWRKCLNKAFAKVALLRQSRGEERNACFLRRGLLVFLSGTPGHIIPGSYVLLKPVAAASLSPASASSSGSKSHGSGGSASSGSGVSTHAVGSGTEGVVAGLCRSGARAGIVSSIDAKAGICEVILTERQRNNADLSATVGRQVEAFSLSGLNMTVRAVRAPFADIVHAEELPLFLDASFPASPILEDMLLDSLEPLLRSVSTIKPDTDVKTISNVHHSDEDNRTNIDSKNGAATNARIASQDSPPLTECFMVVRASTILLSDKSILEQYLKKNGSEVVLHQLLSLASSGAGDSDQATSPESLSSLPVHESKIFQLSSLLQSIKRKEESVRSVARESWEEKISLLKPDDSKTKVEGSNMDDEEGQRSESARSHVESSSEQGSTGAHNNRRQTSGASTDDEDDEEAAAAATHLREAAIAQMAELGLPRSWSELALRRTGGTNIEAAVHFCLERGGDMERLLAEDRERDRSSRQSSSGMSRRRGVRGEGGGSAHLLRQLLEMGFPRNWCAEALAATGNNVDEALTWILTNGERLSAQDEGGEEGGDDEDEGESDEEEDKDEEIDSSQIEGAISSAVTPSESPSAANKVCLPTLAGEVQDKENETEEHSDVIIPLRFLSGKSDINPRTLEISGMPTGGFSSVGTKGLLLTSGKWYYEAILDTAGCLQIGWADGSFAGHCNSDRGDGCGDGPSSWAFDGWRRYRWHSNATEWGCRWKEGDVIGCFVDMDDMVVSFTLNGKGEEIGMGRAFSGSGFRPCGGVFACVSFNQREKIRLILGGDRKEPFKYPPPDGYRGVGEAVSSAITEFDKLLDSEAILSASGPTSVEALAKYSLTSKTGYLCDFSDGEHGHELFAWQHRYYGSDASVHLGTNRTPSKRGGGHRKGSSRNTGSTHTSISSDAAEHISRAWTASEKLSGEELKVGAVLSHIKQGYGEAYQHIFSELQNECGAIGTLYGRKLVLHLIITLGRDFSLKHFIPRKEKNDIIDNMELEVSRKMWFVLDSCISLRAAGWVGEAGAMAVAAEALGLGISGHDSQNNSSQTEQAGLSGQSSTDGSPIGGITQFLTTVVQVNAYNIDPNVGRETSTTLAACAEAAIGGGGGGGPMIFLRHGLRSAVMKSEAFCSLLTAAVRRSVRLLSVVNYVNNDRPGMDESVEDEKEESSVRDGDSAENYSAPDARLACFLTGLLLSTSEALSSDSRLKTRSSLFEAWSIGLLSASAPWRLICASTASAILDMCPEAFPLALQRLPSLANFYGRLEGTVSRRVWAERAAVPICSKYVQAYVELLISVKRTVSTYNTSTMKTLCPSWGQISVDAATPLPLYDNFGSFDAVKPGPHSLSSYCKSWEWDEGWITCDAGWEVWTGSVEHMQVEWKTPARSAVRTLMDGGEGPPMLREGCRVVRGLDWSEEGSGCISGNDDGKDQYEEDKFNRDKLKKSLDEENNVDNDPINDTNNVESDGNSPATPDNEANPAAAIKSDAAASKPEMASPTVSEKKNGSDDDDQQASSSKKKKPKKLPNPKLPVGTVISVETWNGLPGIGRRVKWDRTKIESVYRYGGDGGRYDIGHVEVNEKKQKITKRHPLPESSEQIASRNDFGVNRRYSVILRLNPRWTSKTNEDDESEFFRGGILEWPDFGAGVRVDCLFHADGAVTITEGELLYGSKDSGWYGRFGQPNYVPGTVTVLSKTTSSSGLDTAHSGIYQHEELLGSTSLLVENLRNRADGSRIRVTSEMRLVCGSESLGQGTEDIRIPDSVMHSPMPPPISFDRDWHASSISLSRDGRTVTCTASDGRGTAFGNVGFTKGIHYWEVKLEQADIGSVFIGVAEKPNGSPLSSSGSSNSFGLDNQTRLNKWHGWGFVNFRATYNSGAERVYGAHCHAGDTIGVLLDCDSGRLSFFFDGVKYGEHILNDLGCAFENLSPFGFNADGCGSGGAGQGAPSGIEGSRGGRFPANGSVKPKALWPVVGLRHPGDRVTISTKWMTSLGIDGMSILKNAISVDSILSRYQELDPKEEHEHNLDAPSSPNSGEFPQWFINDALQEYNRWMSGRWLRLNTRGSGPYSLASFGLDVDVDTSPLACAAACASLGLGIALLSGDRVTVKRSAGRILENPEEALILGACQGKLYYRIISQTSEGGSLTEGGGRAWFWDESEVVADGLQLIGGGHGFDIDLPLLDKFKCAYKGGLEVVYSGGAVVRSDLEILDGTASTGTIPKGAIIPHENVLERRVNSCGVVRYRVKHDVVGEGWISSRIRGGKEEPIIKPLSNPSAKENDLEDLEPKSQDERNFTSPFDSALVWLERYTAQIKTTGAIHEGNSIDEIGLMSTHSKWRVESSVEFECLLASGKISGLSSLESDSKLAHAAGAIADFSPIGDAVDCPFMYIATALAFVAKINENDVSELDQLNSGRPDANQAAAAILSSVGDALPPTKALLARIAMLRAFNRRARVALPWLSLRPAQEGSAILGGLCGYGASIERAGRSKDLHASTTQWIQAPSVASRIRQCRRLFFTSVKRSLLFSVVDVTSTPTPLSHDEYELPREVRTVRVNRLKAYRAMASGDDTICKKYSVFSQLQSEMRSWGGAPLRRGFVAKGHGGQKRAFKVKLIGEGVNDYSGPYREVFTDGIREITETNEAGHGILNVLEPTPNTLAAVGENRGLFSFSVGDQQLEIANNSLLQKEADSLVSEEEQLIRKSFSSFLVKTDESWREAEEALMFLGRLAGTACRHGIHIDLPLPLKSVWNAVVEETTDEADALKEIDLLAFRQKELNGNIQDFSTSSLLVTQQRMLNSFVEGMANVIPVELMAILNGTELRGVMCGNVEIDVDLLRRVVEYEGYDETDDVIRFFWEALMEMTNQERKLFLQFVWARNRIPLKESDFDAPFKILKDSKNSGDMADKALPSASTCFFSLTLPQYSSKDLLKHKLSYVINNVCTMESDYVTNDAEVSEGWRGL